MIIIIICTHTHTHAMSNGEKWSDLFVALKLICLPCPLCKIFFWLIAFNSKKWEREKIHELCVAKKNPSLYHFLFVFFPSDSMSLSFFFDLFIQIYHFTTECLSIIIQRLYTFITYSFNVMITRVCFWLVFDL